MNLKNFIKTSVVGIALFCFATVSQADFIDPANNNIIGKPTTQTYINSPTKPEVATQKIIKQMPSNAQAKDYESNTQSDAFGAQLFTGAFISAQSAFFNSEYLISVGDKIQINTWGGFEYSALVSVDQQGNIFIPTVGAIAVAGVQNKQLQARVAAGVKRIYKAYVNVYASLSGAQPVRVYVGGFVRHPGLYDGTSTSGVLHYIDSAGGIDPERGSFIEILIKRNSKTLASINLYDFLLKGEMPASQLQSGDVIFIQPRKSVVKAGGLVENAKKFEIFEQGTNVARLIELARPLPQVTNVRIQRVTGTRVNTEYYALSDADKIKLNNGDTVDFTADKKPGTITVRVEGEHDSAQEYVLPYGEKLGVLLEKIKLNNLSAIDNVQLFRQSVKVRQKEMLEASLRSLESSVLNARSGSSEEAQLRKAEADMTLRWIERAKKIEPLGQAVVANSTNRDQLLLENGDLIRIPRQEDLILVSGEVLFPNAIVYKAGMGVKDYIAQAGGFSNRGDDSRVVLARQDGQFQQVSVGLFGRSVKLKPGDQILVLPKLDNKNRQFWKDITQIMYQIAVSAKVVFGL